MRDFVDALARGIVTGSVYGLIVLPFVFVWRSTRVFCLAQAQISIFAALVTAELGTTVASAGLALVIGAALGLLTYLLAVLPVRRRGDESHGTLVSTLAFGLLVQALMIAIFGGLSQVGDTPFGSLKFRLFTGTTFSDYSYALIVVCLLAGALASRFLTRSDLGIQWRAMGDDRTLAGARGVPVTRMEIACFVVGGIASGLVGYLVASEMPIRPDDGLDFALKAFLVMGFVGLDRPWAGAVGGLVLGMTEAVLLDHLNSGVTSAILVSALILWLVGRGGVRAAAVREF